MLSGKRAWSRYIAGSEKITRVKEFCQDIFTRDYWQNFWPSFAEEWRSSFRSVFAVGRKASWWRASVYFSCYAVVIVLCLVLPLTFLLGTVNQFTGGDTCLPDGRFALESNYSLWDISGIFQITMGFGAFSFSIAKLLDAVWDVAVGRGVQGLLAFIAYKVTAQSLTMSLEKHSVPLGTFEAIALQDSTLIAFYKQVCNFLSIKGWQHQLRMSWIILSTLFIVAFPTLVSAMTGYAPVTDPFLQGGDGQLIPFASYLSVMYIVHDADRIGLNSPLILSNVHADNDFQSPSTGRTKSNLCESEKNTPLRFTEDGVAPGDWNSVDQRCHMIWHVREYVKQYGFLGLNDTSSIFNRSGETYNLSAPALNVEPASWPYYGIDLPLSNYSQRLDQVIPERNWRDPRGGRNSLFRDTEAKYTLNGTNSILTVSDMDRLGNCQQTATYRWGFSFLLLLIVIIFFMVWIVGTYFLWLDTYLHSRLDLVKREMGLYRAALDITSVIQGDLDMDVDPLTPNNLLQKRIRNNKKGGKISLQHLNDALPLNTRMMNIQAWGRTGGYSRWTPRFTLTILLILVIVIPLTSLFMDMDQSTGAGLISLLVLLILVNILILGRGKQRGLRRKASSSEISHHPLRSFDEDQPSPSASRTCTSETATYGSGSNNQSDTDHVELDQPSKTATSVTAVERP